MSNGFLAWERKGRPRPSPPSPRPSYFRAGIPGSWLYAARTSAAALGALYLAYLFELDTPSSAAITVLVVAHPIHGMVWSKSIYRLLGTLVGGLVSLALAGLFAQSPEMYLLGLGAWLALCTGTASLLRNFRSYAAMLAGYTVGLISFPGGIDTAPQAIFEVTAARIAGVSLGIVCSALVASLFTRRSTASVVNRRLSIALRDLCEFTAFVLTDPAADVMEERRCKLRAEIAAIDALIEFGVAEAPEAAAFADAQRLSVMSLFATLTAAGGLHEVLPGAEKRLPARLRDDTRRVLAELDAAAGAQEQAPHMASVALAHLGALRSRVGAAIIPGHLPSLIVLDRLHELLDDLAESIERLQPSARRPMEEVGRRSYHHDWRRAAANGLRAAMTVWLCGAAWIATAWPTGSVMISAAIPNVVLLSLHDRPARDSLQFAEGVALAAIAALAYKLALLPYLADFPTLAAALAVPLFLGALGITKATGTLRGAGFLVFFLVQLSPANVMRYDMTAQLNLSLAVICGAGLTALIYRLVLPANPATQARGLRGAIRTDLLALLRGRQAVRRETWEMRMQDRLLRLANCFPAGNSRQNGLRSGHTALRLGRQIIRLRGLAGNLPEHSAGHTVVVRALRGLRAIDRAPDRVAGLAEKAAMRLLRMTARDDGERFPDLARAAAALAAIASSLRGRRDILADTGSK